MSDTIEVNEVERNRFQVSNALWLLEFAVSSGIDIADDTLHAIHRAQDLAGATTLPSIEERLAFDRAYSALARQVAPVTADTLRWTSDQYAVWAAKRSGPDGHRSLFAPWGPVSDAKIWSRKLWAITVAVILALFICEPFVEGKDADLTVASNDERRDGTIAGVATATSTRTSGPAWNVRWQTARAEASPTPPRGGRRGTSTPRQFTPTVTVTYSATPTSTSTQSPETSTTLCTPLHTLPRSTARLLCMFAALLGKLCPFLYGALGALAFLLRSCHEFIHRRQFDERRVPEYYNRVLLGAVSGGAIQMYVQDQFQGIGVGANAVAFVAGYNTDLLFSYLDRIFSALLPKDASIATTTAALPPATSTSGVPSAPGVPQPDERVARIQRLLAETSVPEYSVSATDGIWDERTRLAIIAFLRSNFSALKSFATLTQAPDFGSYDREQLIAAMSSFVLPASTT